jgi:4,5:9,10-diseco-3-hydroxy-5,9,17-trioxoandrosta-1(10),2-diene-4-oate hydrolase
MAQVREQPNGGAPRRHVVIDGVTLAYDDEGYGSAIVCLHAIGHGAADFAGLRARWRGRYRVLALDWPGQGDSGPDRVPASASRYAVLLEGFLDASGVDRAVLIGNSIGGAVAIRFAASHPERVRGLILENPGGLDRLGPTHWLARRFLEAMVRFHRAGGRRAWWYPAVFAAYYRTVLQRGAAAVRRRRIVASAWDIAPVLEEAWRSFAAPEADLRPLVSRVVCPVLFAWATRDHTVTLARSRAAIGSFSDARLEKFGAGHAAHLETPQAFAEAAERFLAGIEGAAGHSERVAAVS